MKTTKKMTLSQLRKQLFAYSSEELIDLVEKMYKECPDAGQYLNFRLGDPDYAAGVLEETREKVRNGFFSQKGRGRLNFTDAKEEIERFSGYCGNPEMILDLQVSFVENAVEMAVRYRNLPDSFFRSAESMFKTIIRTLNDSSDESLYKTLQERLEGLMTSSIDAEDGLHESLENIYAQLKWNKIPETSIETAEESHLSSKDTAGETLSEEDTRLFYEIWLRLLNYVNKKKQVTDIGKIKFGKKMDLSKIAQIAEVLWNEKSLIDDYIRSKKSLLSEDEKYILNGWKKAVTGTFLLERHLKKGSVFISADNNKVYLVHGITDSWEEMTMFRRCPIILDMTLIPFRDVLIFDGLVFLKDIYIGRGMADFYKEIYKKAKRTGQIIESL